jgi:hypothetical protein
MAVHRLRALLDHPTAREEAPPAPAFVACPAVLLQGYSPAQLQQMQELYRLAREQAEAAQRPRRSFPPAFSLN